MMDLDTFKRRLFGIRRASPAALKRFRAALEGRVPIPAPRRKRRTMESRRLRECCGQSGGMTASGEDFVLRGVRVLGSSSLNRRRYTREAMSGALPMYDGARVFLDHPDKANLSRSVKDLVGVLSGPVQDGDGLSADLILNPAHPFAPAVAWLARSAPNALGLSHNAIGEGQTKDGVFVVNRIVSVRSVDLVIDPATVKGLFS